VVLECWNVRGFQFTYLQIILASSLFLTPSCEKTGVAQPGYFSHEKQTVFVLQLKYYLRFCVKHSCFEHRSGLVVPNPRAGKCRPSVYHVYWRRYQIHVTQFVRDLSLWWESVWKLISCVVWRRVLWQIRVPTFRRNLLPHSRLCNLPSR
jgi:hypothetical protein